MNSLSLSPPSSQSVAAELTTIGNGYRLTHSFWTAAMALLIYDYVITLGDEVEFTWGKKLSIGRLLYWLILAPIQYSVSLSYGVNESETLIVMPRDTDCATFVVLDWPNAPDKASFLPHSSSHLTEADPLAVRIVICYPRILIYFDARCQFYFYWFAYSAWIAHFFINSILTLRIYAMYERRKSILAVLLTVFALECIAEVIMITFITSRFQTLHLPPFLPGCSPSNTTSWAWSIQFALQHGKHMPSLAILLIRDSFLFFGTVLAFILANLVSWHSGNPTAFSIFPVTITVFHSIIGCRMLINMQNALYNAWPQETAVATLPPIKFQRSWRNAISLTDTMSSATMSVPPLEERPELDRLRTQQLA
ncbi:hypothetical protein NM688_g3669 [Phlebia brevispora]|uniref:Uncharacterized protein n=1 Tax=Phlebia brevispora TaxID=194682 RepID=A0ACC1T595_9APHY|nr:hypothetical protein NM688_g3669 [Phlebia brevispora]